MMNTLTRRAALSGAVASAAMVGVAAAVTMPVAARSQLDTGTASFRATMAAYKAACARFDATPDDMEHTDPAGFKHEERIFYDIALKADNAVPESWADFALYLSHHTSDGAQRLTLDQTKQMLAHARRLEKTEG